MGRFTKKAVVFYCVMLICWLPVSVIAASVDCLFHEKSSFTIENSVSHSTHDSFIDLTDIDFDIEHENMSTQDSSCSTKLIVAVAHGFQFGDENVWTQAYAKDTKSYQLTAVLLPRDIRPPISFSI